jgi:hypothetical protein
MLAVACAGAHTSVLQNNTMLMRSLSEGVNFDTAQMIVST